MQNRLDIHAVEARVEGILLDLDRLSGAGIYRAKNNLRALKHDVKAELQRLETELRKAKETE